jgi:hypothetical protein
MGYKHASLCAEIECLSARKRDIPLAVGFSVLLTTKSMKLDGRVSVSNCESSRSHQPFQHEAPKKLYTTVTLPLY